MSRCQDKKPQTRTHTQKKIYLGNNRLSYEKVSTRKIQMGFSGNLKFSIQWCFLLFGLCKSFCYLCAAPVSHHSSQGHCADTEALLGFLPCGKIRKSKPRHKKAARKVQNELPNTTGERFYHPARPIGYIKSSVLTLCVAYNEVEQCSCCSGKMHLLICKK